MKNETRKLLQQSLQLNSIPTARIKSEWELENKVGFLYGIVEYGSSSHIDRLHDLLSKKQFSQLTEFSRNPLTPKTFLDEMFDFYVLPFHKSYKTDSSCHTPSNNSSKPPSRTNSNDDLDYIPEEKESTHGQFKKYVASRDGVCLFCWGRDETEGAHIIAQKTDNPVDYDENSILRRAGLTWKHLVQNGLLLCSVCHGLFDKLKRYVDVVGDKLVLKVVNGTNDEDNLDWKDTIDDLKVIRKQRQRRWIDVDNREAVDKDGEMVLWFLKTDPTLQPNHKALEFHKTACLIWRLAGGAEEDVEYCPDDDDEDHISLVGDEMGVKEKVAHYFKHSINLPH